MKTFCLLIVSIFICTTLAEAQGWEELGSGTNTLAANGAIRGVVTDAQNNVYAGGYFTNADGFYYVAKWNGTSWAELGSGSNRLNANGPIRCMIKDDQDNIYVAGAFRDANGGHYVAKWNGTSWSALGIGPKALSADNVIVCMAIDQAGAVYASGQFKMSNVYLPYSYSVVKWDGTSWTTLPIESGTDFSNIGNILTMAASDDGYLYVGGSGGHVGVWDGTRWGFINAPLNGERLFYSMQMDHDNNLYIGGNIQDYSGKTCLARWDGTGWSRPGTGANSMNANSYVWSIVLDEQDNIYAGGFFTDVNNTYYVAKWDGITWTELGGNAGNALNANDNIFSVAVDPSGNVYTGGMFTNEAGKMYVAKWTKPAVATSTRAADNIIEVSMYPNPSTGTFTIRTDDAIESVTLINTIGQKEVFASGLNITTSFTGMVLVEVQTASGRAIKKIVIQ
jgi:hypothetical protein